MGTHFGRDNWNVIRLVDTFNLERRKSWCWKERGAFPIIHSGVSATQANDAFTAIDIPTDKNEFRLEGSITGIRSGEEPVFEKLLKDETISKRHRYLVATPSGDLIVTRVSELNNVLKATGVRGHESFELSSNDIKARLKKG